MIANVRHFGNIYKYTVTHKPIWKGVHPRDISSKVNDTEYMEYNVGNIL